MYFHIWQLANYTLLHIVPYASWYSYSVPYIREPILLCPDILCDPANRFLKLVILRHLIFCSLPFFCRPFCFHPSAFSRFSCNFRIHIAFYLTVSFLVANMGNEVAAIKRGGRKFAVESACTQTEAHRGTQRHTKKHASQRVEEIGLMQKRVRQRGKRTREIFVECKRTFDHEKETTLFIAQPYRTSSAVTSHCANVSLSLSWE